MKISIVKGENLLDYLVFLSSVFVARKAMFLEANKFNVVNFLAITTNHSDIFYCDLCSIQKIV